MNLLIYLFIYSFVNLLIIFTNLKALWLKQNEIKNWNNAITICEKQDFINFRLSGNLCCSSTNCAARWHWDSEIACEHYSESKKTVLEDSLHSVLEEDEYTEENEDTVDQEISKHNSGDERGIEKEVEVRDITSGRPVSLLSKIDLSDLLGKWPAVCIPMGARVGLLTHGTSVRAHTRSCT